MIYSKSWLYKIILKTFFSTFQNYQICPKMSFFIYLSAIFVISHVYPVSSHSVGPPISPIICATLNPIGHLELVPRPFLPEPDYRIVTNKDWFSPNERISISIISNSSTPFKGLILQVRGRAERIIGSFVLSQDDPDFKYYRCDYVIPNIQNNSTVTHKNGKNKNNATLLWMAPPSCDRSTIYEIRATVIRSIAVYQSGLRKILECRPNEEEESLDPTSTGQQNEEQTCQFENLTSIPQGKYQTSFENGTLNGWNNAGWTLFEGPTPTYRTGPSSAADGDFYIYLETSNYLRPKAFLSTEQDLRGCFCLKFMHSHNVDNGRNHKLIVRVGGKAIYVATKKNSNWTSVSLQIDSYTFTKVEFVGNRGTNFRGDMALDDVRLVPGICSPDETTD